MKDRRKRISKPKVFNEKRESMILIRQASPTDIYLWAVSIMFMLACLVFIITYSYFNYTN